MNEHPRARAVARQLEASDPNVSAFVGASAGSGKTKLLTDRLLRLMLNGAAPEKIQCLTFTKAAAAEMSNRVADRLARWAILDDGALIDDVARFAEPSPEILKAARRLFAMSQTRRSPFGSQTGPSGKRRPSATMS